MESLSLGIALPYLCAIKYVVMFSFGLPDMLFLHQKNFFITITDTKSPAWPGFLYFNDVIPNLLQMIIFAGVIPVC